MENLLYIIGVIVLTIGVMFLAKYLRKNKFVNKEDLELTTKILEFINKSTKNLNIENEKELHRIIESVILSLNFVMKNYEDKKMAVDVATNYAMGLCLKFNIPLNMESQELIKEVFEFLLEDKDILNRLKL